MTKILKLFSLLLMAVFSAVFADSTVDLEKYRLTVTEIDPEFHCFRLSNHMIFNIPKKNWEKVELLEVGTEVYLKPIGRKVTSRLSCEEGNLCVCFSKNPKKKCMLVWMPKESEEHCLTYVSSELICTAPSGWFSSQEYRYVMTLSDQSKWVMKRDGESNFRLGERVIVSRGKEDEFYLINIDRTAVRKHVYVHNDAFMWQESVIVKPYVPEQITKE